MRKNRIAKQLKAATITAKSHIEILIAARRDKEDPATTLCERGATKNGNAPNMTTIIAILKILENALKYDILRAEICREFVGIQSGHGTTDGRLPHRAEGLLLRNSISDRKSVV